MKSSPETTAGEHRTRRQKTHRAMELLETLHRLGGSARTRELAATMNVSEETIRRTVKKLSADGTVSRVHGGVFLAAGAEGTAFHQRIGERSQEKRQMAELVATLVENGTSLFMDVGSTTAYVAEALRPKAQLFVVTNSLAVAQTLMGHNGNRVFLTGGEVSAGVSGVVDTSALDFVARFRLDTAILSSDALEAGRGFLLSDYAEAALARSFVRQSVRRIMVVDHSKSCRTAPMLVCDPREIDILVTDQAPGPDLMAAVETWGIRTMIAPPKGRQTP